jgi:hypothetical protein
MSLGGNQTNFLNLQKLKESIDRCTKRERRQTIDIAKLSLFMGDGKEQKTRNNWQSMLKTTDIESI